MTLLSMAMAALAPCPAGATTGPTPLAHPPRFNVTKGEAAPYLGRFKLVQPSSRQLISGAYVAGYNERGFVEGTMAIYTYDAEGRETVLLGRTYEYHARGDQMTIDIISPENQVILARLRLTRGAGNRLTGHLRSLVPPGAARKITLAPTSPPRSGNRSDASQARPEPSATRAGEAGPRPAPNVPVSAIVDVVRKAFRF